MHRFIYYDMNLVVDCITQRDKQVLEKTFFLKEKNFKFPYSPAHMEEIASIFRSAKNENDANQYVAKHIGFIIWLSENHVLLPSYDHSVITKREDPRICFKRVIDNYDMTIYAEEGEKFIQSIRDTETFMEYYEELGIDGDKLQGIDLFEDFQKLHSINKKEINHVQPEEIFNLDGVIDAFNSKMLVYGYEHSTIPKYQDMKNNHSQLEVVVNLCFNFLEALGYRTEKKGKYRSRMHDVTHAIYATKTDFFIIGDERYRIKTRAVYNFLEVPVKVLSKEEFLISFILDDQE